ncbi:hypothetical protein Pint_04995 [Pistacia integerrima]|uniref:Uncharacterized protein n=1 Tax=Pistacia integerrima TaxID=434235 RepID=A0ACC0Z439_9ROSI|nr:hypothetical protein Pint_04995 [Pistacia integerrima]
MEGASAVNLQFGCLLKGVVSAKFPFRGVSVAEFCSLFCSQKACKSLLILLCSTLL